MPLLYHKERSTNSFISKIFSKYSLATLKEPQFYAKLNLNFESIGGFFLKKGIFR
jgi:hypothetical protein